MNGVGAFFLFLLFCMYGVLSKHGNDATPGMITAALVLVPPAASAFAGGYYFTNGKKTAWWFAALPLLLLLVAFPIGTLFALRIRHSVQASDAELT